jgi:hypothetical protein
VQVLALVDSALGFGVADEARALHGLREDCVAWLAAHRGAWLARAFADLPG